MGWLSDIGDAIKNAGEFLGGEGDSADNAKDAGEDTLKFVADITGVTAAEDAFGTWLTDPKDAFERAFVPEFGALKPGDVNVRIPKPDRVLTPSIDQARIDSDYARAMRERRGRAAAILGGGGGAGYGLVSRPAAGSGSRALMG